NGVVFSSGRFGRGPLKVRGQLPVGVSTVSTEFGLALAINNGDDLLYVQESDAKPGIVKARTTTCDAACRGEWRPFRAAEIATAAPPWSIEGRDGVSQWSYK